MTLKYIQAQAVLGINPEDWRDLSWDYLGADKERDTEVYPDPVFVNGGSEVSDDTALFLANMFQGVAEVSGEFDNPGGEMGGRWFIKLPAGMTIEAKALAHVYRGRLEHYDGLIYNWNQKGRQGRAAGVDPEQQNPIITTTIKLAEMYD